MQAIPPASPIKELTFLLQPGVPLQPAAVASVRVGQVGPGRVRAHRAVVGRVAERAAVGGRRRLERPVVLRGRVQAVELVRVVRQSRRGLRVSGEAVAAAFQKGRFGRVGGDQSVRQRTHRHHRGCGSEAMPGHPLWTTTAIVRPAKNKEATNRKMLWGKSARIRMGRPN